MSEANYNKDTIDEMFRGVHTRFDGQDKNLELILKQTTDHNHRMSKIEKVLLVVGTAVLVLLITNGSKFVGFVSAIFVP
jgi:hypothetical protein